MSESPHKKQEFLETAKHQYAQISAEFEKAMHAVKDPERRKQLTSSYLEMLQKGLSKAQESVAKYQERMTPHPDSDQPASGATPAASESPEPTVTPPESGPEQPVTPPT
jgi:hypothetical protein